MPTVRLACLLALSLSSAWSPARADRAPQPAPPAPAPTSCMVTVDAPLLLEIEHVGDPGFEGVDTRFALTIKGAWSYTTRTRGKLLESSSGCVPTLEYRPLEAVLAKATWKTSRADARCTMMATSSIRYRYQGKLVLTSRACDGVILDAATRRAIIDATRLSERLIRRTPTPAR